MKKVVIALGGNALGNTNDEQLKNVKNVSEKIVDLVANGYDVVITHGNGPQVGMINNALDTEDNKIPFPECNAMSQGYIGYHLSQFITNELEKRKINKTCVSVVTQVVVSKDDKAFSNPTKPIGNFLDKKEKEKQEKQKGYVFKEFLDGRFRRVVPSPKPEEIVEIDAIKEIIDQGNIVIACGGGGIPVIRERNKLVGIDAVIDKDLSSSLLAKEIDADMFVILTNVDYVYINYGKDNQEKLIKIDEKKANEYIEAHEFAEGSMLPKIKACLKFTVDTSKDSVITSLDRVLDGVKEDAGTVICSNIKEEKNMADKKKEAKKKNFKFGLSAFSIILLLTIILGIATHLLPEAAFEGEEIVHGSGVVAATLSDVLMAPILGFENAIDVCIFVFILGGFLKIVSETGALETGVKALVRKLKGHELILIPILMFIFSIGGTTYGMLEETVGFYALLAATMVVAGMDTIVASAIVLLGAGCGVLGSTINPFATGAAVAALPEGLATNQGIIMVIGVALWLVSLGIAVSFVMLYAAKVKRDKGSTFLSLQEQKVMEERYGKEEKVREIKKVKTNKLSVSNILGILVFGGLFIWRFVLLVICFFKKDPITIKAVAILLVLGVIAALLIMYASKIKKQGRLVDPEAPTDRQVLTLYIFGATFLVMVFGFIPWGEFVNTDGLAFSSFLTGAALGDWWFFDAALWFLISSIIIGIINRQGEKGIVSNFVSGAADMMSVVLIIAVARGVTVLMGVTKLDDYIIYNAAEGLRNMPVLLFTPLNYLLHVGLSFLVPSSSGLAAISAPIIGPLAAQLGYNVEGSIMTIVAANGLVNLFTPTCGAIMAGLALAGVEYTTWLKWSIKIILSIALASVIILCMAMLLF